MPEYEVTLTHIVTYETKTIFADNKDKARDLYFKLYYKDNNIVEVSNPMKFVLIEE